MIANHAKPTADRPRLIGLQEVVRATGLSRSTLYRMLDARKFPQPITVEGARRILWIEAEVVAWIERQIEAARA
jgi:prophage regulatory protein